MTTNLKIPCAFILAGACLAAALPQLSWAAVPRTMPSEYRTVFQQKSIFSRERTIGQDDGSYGPGGRRRFASFPPVFVGVVDVAGQPYASLEEPRSGEVTLYSIGGILPQNYGRVEAVNLESIMVRSTSGLRQIKLGQNVSGGSRPSTEDIEAADLANGPLVPAAPSGGGAAGASSGGGDDAVAKLIAKRRAELQAAAKPPGGTQ